MLSLESSESLSLVTLILCFFFLSALFKRYGLLGLYVYYVASVVVSNLQLIRFAPFSIASEPLALGTVVFSTTFLASDIITEHYGPKAARAAIGLGFGVQLFVTLMMMLTLYHPMPVQGTIDSLSYQNMVQGHEALSKVFTPSLRFLIASLCAFSISQLLDIWIFQKIRQSSGKRYLWLRQNISMFLSGIVDHIVFSLLAWNLLTDSPLSLIFLFKGMIWGSSVLRWFVQVLSTPMMYLSYSLRPHLSLKNSSAPLG